MSEEEKEAIEIIEQWKNIKSNGQPIQFLQISMNNLQNAIDTILDYIDKLQKENTNLKEELKNKSIIDLEKYVKLDTISVLGKEYFSKDKIRDKIKELEEVKQKEEKENKDEFGINSNTWAIADWGIEVLKELLVEDLLEG